MQLHDPPPPEGVAGGGKTGNLAPFIIAAETRIN